MRIAVNYSGCLNFIKHSHFIFNSILAKNNFDFVRAESNLERMIREAEIQNADVVSAAYVDQKGSDSKVFDYFFENGDLSSVDFSARKIWQLFAVVTNLSRPAMNSEYFEIHTMFIFQYKRNPK